MYTESRAVPTTGNVNYDYKEVLKEPYAYLLQIPGKRVRSKLIDAFDLWLKIGSEVKVEIKAIVEMLHTASLLLDDIEDNSELRRGIPVAHHIYGVASTINSANYIIFLALERCHRLGNPIATSAFLDEMIKLHEGQGFDILWRDQHHCPSPQQYEQMVLDKTGGLFRLAVRLMQAFSNVNTNTPTNYTDLVNALGLYFQIQDDYMNLQSAEYADNKSYCEDLTEGKFSFPIIHAINCNLNDHRLMNILKQRTSKISLKQYAVSYMEQVGSFEYTRNYLKQLQQRTLDLIQKHGGNEDITAIVNALAAKVEATATTSSSSSSSSGGGGGGGGVAIALPKTPVAASSAGQEKNSVLPEGGGGATQLNVDQEKRRPLKLSLSADFVDEDEEDA